MKSALRTMTMRFVIVYIISFKIYMKGNLQI